MSEIEKKEEWYLNIDYREAKEIIRNKLQGMTQNFIGIGFYLRQIKESEGFRKDGYESIYEFAEDQYGIKRSTAIRWMQMNEKFSQGGYSPFLDSGYKDFGKSQLQEMLYLDSEQLEEVTPEMTVREIREIRNTGSGTRRAASRSDERGRFSRSFAGARRTADRRDKSRTAEADRRSMGILKCICKRIYKTSQELVPGELSEQSYGCDDKSYTDQTGIL